MEYLIAGKKTEKENLAYIARRLLVIRTLVTSYFILKSAGLFINGTFLPAISAVTSIHASSNASITRINHCIPADIDFYSKEKEEDNSSAARFFKSLLKGDESKELNQDKLLGEINRNCSINHCIPVINGPIPVKPTIAVAVARLFDWNDAFVLT